jgi:sugar phosphate isomerase/epimerase
VTSNFTLSLAHATLLDLPPPELVRVAAATGYDTVGLRLIPMGRPGEPRHGFDENPGSLRETRRALAETGVRLLDVEVVQIKKGIDPRAYLPVLEATAELGGRCALTNVYTADRAAAEDGLAVLCDLVKPLGLTIALEFVSFSDLPTLRQTIEMIRGCGRENAAVLIDTLHFHSSREPLSAVAEIPHERVHYVHVCDGPGVVPTAPDDLRRIAREERLFPGEGGIDVAGILQHLPADVVYAIEVQNPARARALGAEAYARLAFETTRRYLAERCGDRDAT